MILGGPKIQSSLDKEIERLLIYISDVPPDSDEYKAIRKELSALHELSQAEKPKPVDKNTILTVAANIAGILVIVGHERAHVVTSKAFGHIRQLR